MLNEITLPVDYTGTLEQENDVIGKINKNFIDIEKEILEKSSESMNFEQHIIDFEEYEIDLYFSENKSKATIVLDDNNILVTINGKTTRIDENGDVV